MQEKWCFKSITIGKLDPVHKKQQIKPKALNTKYLQIFDVYLAEFSGDGVQNNMINN